MKKNIKIISVFICIITLTSCYNEEILTESQIDTTAPIRSRLDSILLNDFLTPYNIDIRYQFSAGDNNVNRFLYPPLESSVEPIANTLQKVWIEPFNEIGGADFIAKFAPRQFVLSGGFNFNPGLPTITLGFAEAGARITLFNIDFIDFSVLDYRENNLTSYVNPIKTIHHEYGHILNQTIRVDDIYGLITPGSYTGQWADFSLETAHRLGFISRYARASENEDFVEMVSEMLIRSRSEFDALVNGIVDENGEPAIGAINILRQKEELVVEYYLENFNIDFYALQELTSKALKDLQE